jgi:brefeldin A-inhibited guanine nucleotide-exchange protein
MSLKTLEKLKLSLDRALNYLFDTIIKYGKDFPPEFWDTIWRQLLYPIFMVMRSKPEMSKMVNHEELSVWLSTTMIQALRNMMTLFTHYFESLEYMLDRFLDLLALCICQENDTLARIGSNCLQTLILQNVNKFTEEHWTKIVSAFVDLFNRTEATALFSAVTNPNGTNGTSRPSLSRNLTSEASVSDSAPPRTPTRQSTRDSTRSTSGMSNGDKMGNIGTGMQSPTSTEPPTPGALEDYRPEEKQLHQAPIVVTAARRRFFNQIITKCVLQLLLIETVNELFSNDNVYAQIPSMELLRLMALLKKSYQFAKRFNDDLDLRNRLFQEGFMKQPPNLLKQESGSASVYVNILFRMYHDEGEERKNNRSQTEAALIPLCVDIIASYLQLKEETQQRNIITWRPVVIDVIDGYAALPQEGFEKHARTFAPLTTSLLGRDMGIELQRVVQALVHRIFELHYEMPALEAPPVEEAMMSPNGKAQSFGGRTRRASRTSLPR